MKANHNLGLEIVALEFEQRLERVEPVRLVVLLSPSESKSNQVNQRHDHDLHKNTTEQR